MKFIIYEIRCLDNTKNECYIGSTKNFQQRKHDHKTLSHTNCENLKTKRRLYIYIKSHGGWENFEMIPVEEYECDSLLQAKIREQYWIETKNSQLNVLRAYRSITVRQEQLKANYEKNKEKNKEKSKKYYKTNKELIATKSKQYREKKINNKYVNTKN